MYVTIYGNEGDMYYYSIVYLCWHANTATNMQPSYVNIRYDYVNMQLKSFMWTCLEITLKCDLFVNLCNNYVIT